MACRLLIHLHPCIPTNVRPKTAISDHNGALRNGRLGLRDVANGISKLGSQLGVDMASNILKEFWPDLERKFSRKDKSTGNGSF